jgi:predicted ATPase
LHRGELAYARATAENFVTDAESAGDLTAAGAATRVLGWILLLQGEFLSALSHLDRAAESYDAERDRESGHRFGSDTRIGAGAAAALAAWLLGDTVEARRRRENALAGAAAIGHPPTFVNTQSLLVLFEDVRGDARAVKAAASVMADVSREHGMKLFSAWSALALAWSGARLGDSESGLGGLCQALSDHAALGAKTFLPLYEGLCSELEAEVRPSDAVTRIEEAIALARETGERWTDAMLHRIRGEILCTCDPPQPALAEQAFKSAIAIAREQGARVFELRAALALANLLRKTGRAGECRETLASALKGLPPSADLQEIVEARAMLAF